MAGEGMEATQEVEDDVRDYERERHKPQFNAKAGGRFVGSGWLGEGRFGKYISISFREGLPTGAKVFLSPRRGCEGILG